MPKSLWECSGSQKFVYYSENDEKKLAVVLQMVKVDIPANLVFVAHGPLQRAGARWNWAHVLWYHTFVLPEGADLKDALEFAHRAWFGCGSALFDLWRWAIW